LIVKVADFGLAKLFPHEGMRQSTGTHVGTPGYAPPEILNHEMYSYNVDVWTLGICMYIILTGCPPFKQDMDPKTQDMIRHADECLHFPESHFSAVSSSAKANLLSCQRCVKRHKF
jgi:calcium-dependent protein kinase